MQLCLFDYDSLEAILPPIRLPTVTLWISCEAEFYSIECVDVGAANMALLLLNPTFWDVEKYKIVEGSFDTAFSRPEDVYAGCGPPLMRHRYYSGLDGDYMWPVYSDW